MYITALVQGRLQQFSGATLEWVGRLLHRAQWRCAGTTQRVAGEARVLCAQADALIRRHERRVRPTGPSAQSYAHRAA